MASPSTVTVADATPSDADGMREIFDEAMGTDYISKDLLLDYVRQRDGRIALVCRVDEVQIGALLGWTGPTGEVLGDDVPADQMKAVRAWLPDERIGLLRSVAVTPAARGKGAGAALCAELFRRFDDAGLASATIAWDAPDGCHICPIAERLGMKRLGLLNGFWTKDAQTRGYDCPLCRRGCSCGAIVLRRPPQGPAA